MVGKSKTEDTCDRFCSVAAGSPMFSSTALGRTLINTISMGCCLAYMKAKNCKGPSKSSGLTTMAQFRNESLWWDMILAQGGRPTAR